MKANKQYKKKPALNSGNRGFDLNIVTAFINGVKYTFVNGGGIFNSLGDKIA